MIDYSTYLLSGKEKIRLNIAVALGLILISELFFGNMLFVIAFPLVYKFVKGGLCRILLEKRKSELNMQFRDCLYSMAASFSSGRHMRDAVQDARESLNDLYGEKAYMVMELDQMIARMDIISQDDIYVWKDFAERSASEDIYSFIGVYEACRDSGGNIVSAINKAAIIITEKITIEHEMKTQMIQRKYEGQIIGLMPFVMLIFLRITSSDYISVMYDTLTGKLLMLISLCLIGISSFIEEKITSIEI